MILFVREKMLVTSIFLLFQQCFLPFPKQILFLQSDLFPRLQNAVILNQSGSVFFGKK